MYGKLFKMNSFCTLIFAALCSGVVWARSESTTLSSIASTSSNPKSSAKVKRQYQYPFARPPNYSPFVGDAAANNAQRNADARAETVNQIDQKDLNGNYNYAYETTNGIKVRQTSYMVGPNRVVVGYYSYIGPDGKVYTTHYTADQNGYRATGSHLPVQNAAVQPLPAFPREPSPGPFVSGTPGPIISSTPAPFVSSTPNPFAPSIPFGSSSSPFNNAPSPTQYREPFRLPYREPNRGFNVGSPSTPSPIVSSSTPIISTASPFVGSSTRPPFPVYRQPAAQFQGYVYNTPRINSPYSVVTQQTPAPIFFPSSTYASAPSNINARILSSQAPPSPFNDFNTIASSTISPDNDVPVQFKQYIPPVPIETSTPRTFDNFARNHPDTVLITPKPSYQQPLPNSLSINQNLLPPYLSVGPLNSSPGPQNLLRDNTNFINGPPFEFRNSIQPSPQTVAPLTVTNLNFRKKRNEKN